MTLDIPDGIGEAPAAPATPETFLAFARLLAPGSAMVQLICPNCGQSAVVRMEIEAELRMLSDEGHLMVRTKADKAPHFCDQLSLPLSESEFEKHRREGDAIVDAWAVEGLGKVGVEKAQFTIEGLDTADLSEMEVLSDTDSTADAERGLDVSIPKALRHE